MANPSVNRDKYENIVKILWMSMEEWKCNLDFEWTNPRVPNSQVLVMLLIYLFLYFKFSNLTINFEFNDKSGK